MPDEPAPIRLQQVATTGFITVGTGLNLSIGLPDLSHPAKRQARLLSRRKKQSTPHEALGDSVEALIDQTQPSKS